MVVRGVAHHREDVLDRSLDRGATRDDCQCPSFSGEESGLLYGELVNLAVAGGFGALAAVALIGGLATLARRPSGGVLVALASGASLTLYLALGYPEPWWLIRLGLATVVAIVYALAFGRSSGPGSPAS